MQKRASDGQPSSSTLMTLCTSLMVLLCGPSIAHVACTSARSIPQSKTLSKGANARTDDEDGVTPLMRAARDGELKTFRSLLKRGADVNTKDFGYRCRWNSV